MGALARGVPFDSIPYSTRIEHKIMSKEMDLQELQPANVFISYSHADERLVNELKVFLRPLVDSKIINLWYDRCIDAGSVWNEEIEEHLIGASIVIYCVSATFLNSKACRLEVEKGYKLFEEGRVFVIPVVFRACGWQDVEPFKSRQLLPNDGRPVFSDEKTKDVLLKEVYDKIREKAEIAKRIATISFSEGWKNEFTSLGALSNVLVHHENHITIDDLFVYPDLHDISPNIKNPDQYIDASRVLDEKDKYHGIIISGESQSGKTCLAYKYIERLFSEGYIPIYLSGRNRHTENWERRIFNAIKEQYSDDMIISGNRKKLIIPVVDDLHRAVDVDEIVANISPYKMAIVVVDEIYSLNIERYSFQGNYRSLRIVPMSATKRNSIIKKWIRVVDEYGETGENDNFKRLDELMSHVDVTLGKVLGNGIITAYPFFVLLILAMAKSLQPSSISNITSQGYCYQALITIALANAGVEGTKTEMYFNYLEVLAHRFRNKPEIGMEEIKEFNAEYADKYNLSVKEEALLKTLHRSGLFYKHSTGYYSFAQPYLKFYFVAKYIAGHFNDCEREYNEMVRNLNSNSNAYTVVFVSHHMKSGEQLNILKSEAASIYGNDIIPCYFEPTDMEEVDKNYRHVIKVIMPVLSQSPESERKRILLRQDEMERKKSKEPETESSENNDASEVSSFVKAIRLSDTIGQIIKSREGSMEKSELKTLINIVVTLYAKTIRSFLASFIDNPTEIIDWISDLLSAKDKTRSPEAQKGKASFIFWNINYFVLLAITTKCARSIGSEALYGVLSEVCKDWDMPLHKLLLFFVDMWYNKRINVDEVIRVNRQKDMPISVKWILKRLITRYCSTHKLDFRARQKLAIGLEIPYEMPKCID